jgi:hypothetical protein
MLFNAMREKPQVSLSFSKCSPNRAASRGESNSTEASLSPSDDSPSICRCNRCHVLNNEVAELRRKLECRDQQIDYLEATLNEVLARFRLHVESNAGDDENRFQSDNNTLPQKELAITGSASQSALESKHPSNESDSSSKRGRGRMQLSPHAKDLECIQAFGVCSDSDSDLLSRAQNLNARLLILHDKMIAQKR